MRSENDKRPSRSRQRYQGVPGVVYPSHELHVKPGYNPHTGQPYTAAPSKGITTQQAAEILGSSASAARVMLKKNKIPYQLVSIDGASPRHYWKKQRVESLSSKRPPLVENSSDMKRFLTMSDVVARSGTARSTVLRAVSDGQLSIVRVRMRTEQGPQKRCFFRLSDVRKWCNKRRAEARRREQARWGDHPDDEPQE